MSVRKIFPRIILPTLIILLLTLPLGVLHAGDEEIKVKLKHEQGSGGAFMGIYPAELDDESREALDFEKGKGILVEDIVEDGPSEKAGLEGGDIIIKIAKYKIASLKDLRKSLGTRKPGDKIKVVVLRNGKNK